MRPSFARSARALLLALGILSCTDAPLGPRSVVAPNSARFDEAPAPKVRISQIYGAGGNANALFNADFVELYNEGSAPQDLTGWSVQYTSATGTGNLGASPNLATLSGTLNPGQYYLIGMAPGANGAALPTPDKVGTLSMAAGAGKVILADQATSLACNGSTVSCAPFAAHIIDLVGYGTGASGANFFEGAGGAPTIDATHSAVRKDPCVDTNDNTADFKSITPPAPHNSSTTTAACSGGGGPVIGPLDHVALTGVPALGTPGNTITLAVPNTVVLTAALQDASNQAISDPAATYDWQSSNSAVAEVQTFGGNQATIKADAGGGPVTITVTATSNGVTKTQTASVTVTSVPVNNGPIVPTTTFVSELHYDNIGTDANEAIEIESPAGASLTGWSLVLYDGATGNPYTNGSTWPLTGITPTTCGSRQVIVVNFPVNGLQNGSQDGVTPTVPDGWAIVDDQGHPVEFGSYEGTFVGASGPAANFLSTDIGIQEVGANTSATQSLQRAANGVWFGPKTNSFGTCNPATPPAPETIIIQDRPTPLPVGFQDQFFIGSGSKDNHGNPVTGSGVTWSSSAPSIVSVDSRGILTALANGAATIIATATSDGATGSAAVIANTPPVSAGARVGHNTDLGIPTDADPTDDKIITRRQYTLSYNPNHGDPNWVSWNLDATHKGSQPRCDCFSADPALTALGITAYNTADWINGGVYSRGHMSPSADWNVSDGDNAPTFYLSNMLPQNQTLNSGAWGDLENHLRDVAVGSTEIYIVAGGIFTKNRSGPGVDGLGFMNSTGHIAVPDSIWKIAIIVPDGRSAGQITSPSDVQVIAANFPNNASGTGSYTNYLTTIDKIQKSTGYDFLSVLPQDIQCKIEVRNCSPTARIAGAGLAGGNEGQTLSFDASTSTDPENDALSYQWSVNGTTVGIGPTLNYAFPNNGSFEVKVIVCDVSGGFGIATATVSIANVAPVVAAFDGATVSKGATYSATGSFTDPGSDTWTATVNYGDGGGTKPLTLNGKNFTLNHTYAYAAGTFTVTVTINDGDASAAQTATVTVVNHPPVAHIAGAGVNGGPEGTPLNFDASTSTDPDQGDILSYQWKVNGQVAGTGSALNYAFPDNGTYTVDLLVSDMSGATSTSSVTVAVTNVAPTATLAAPTTVTRGGSIALSVMNVTDKSSVDQAAGFTFAFDCGAGYGSFSATATASCTAFQAGTRIVRAKVRDKDNGVTEVLASVAVLAEPTALVRHAPQLNSNIDGSLQMFLGENVTMNGGSKITGNLYVPGTPTVRLNGSPALGANVDASGSASPSSYTVTLNSGVSLATLVRRTDAGVIPSVGAPTAPAGTRSVQLNSPSDQVGDWATVRNLTLNGDVAPVAVPAGNYGEIAVNGSNHIVLGTPGTTSVYNLQRLTLNGQAVVDIAGPVVLTVGTTLQVNGPSVGAVGHPEWLMLQVAQGDLTLNGSTTLTGVVLVPNGTVTINKGSSLVGGLASDRLTLNVNSQLKITMGITTP